MDIKSALIAGNAPSLANIDYRLLPNNYDVFRCNQFYFEDQYFTGKNIKYAFFNPAIFFEQYYTAGLLEEKNQYHIEQLVLNSMGLPYDVCARKIEKDLLYFPKALLAREALQKLPTYHAYIKFNKLYRGRNPTSGIAMIAFAIAQGYRAIYVAGIDLYQGAQKYAFEHYKTETLLSKYPKFEEKNIAQEDMERPMHTASYDLQALQFLSDKYDVNIYSICPTSPLHTHLKTPRKTHGGGG